MTRKRNSAQKSIPSPAIVAGVLVLLTLGLALKINWGTVRSYKSPEGKYEVRFPANFSLHVNKVKVQGKNVYHDVANVIELDAPGKPKPYILISFSDNMDDQTVEEYLKNTSECEAIENTPGQEVFVGGQRGLLFRNIACNSEGETRIYITRGTRGYSITFNEKEVDQKYLDIILQNLSFI